MVQAGSPHNLHKLECANVSACHDWSPASNSLTQAKRLSPVLSCRFSCCTRGGKMPTCLRASLSG
eukprot:1158558-Pelagomonas_calceolata.AAC.2